MMRFSFNWRFLPPVTAAAVLVILFGLNTQTAFADPHAVFYTVSGQQQLFFNMLAALDQADYVEPAKPTVGLPSGESREKLLEKRTTAGFGPEKSGVLNATKTELAGVLARGITLEGNDLWSSYLAHQFALETARRTDSAEVIRVFCMRGLGFKDCAENQENPKIAQARKDHTFETDPEAPVDRAVAAGEAVAISGTAIDQTIRRNDLSPNNLDPNKFRPYNTTIAALWAAAGSDPNKLYLVQNLVSNVLNISSSAVSSNTLRALTIDSNGNATLAQPSAGESSLDSLTTAFSDILSQPAQILSSVTSAQNSQEAVDATKTVDGIKADTFPVAYAAPGGKIGQIDERLRAPAAAKVAQLDTAVQTVGNVTSTREYASAEEHKAGKQQIVNRSGGKAKGISSDQQLDGTGQVLAAESDNESDGVDQDIGPAPTDQPAIPLDSNPTAFTRETSIEDFLSLLVGGSNRGGCGCSVDDIVNTYGPEINE